MPKLTIAIPFYAGLDLLDRAIRSALAQSERDVAVLVVDDGKESSGAEALARSFADERLRYVRNETNLGIGGNWNRCLELAGTELVTLLHADDELEAGYAAAMLAAAKSDPAAAAFFCEASIIGENGRRTFSLADYVKRWLRPAGFLRLAGEPGVESLLKGNFIICPTLCWRRERIGPAPFRRDRKMVLDFELTLSLLFSGAALVGLPEKLYRYRRHGGNQTTLLTRSLIRFEEEDRLYEWARSECERKLWHRAARRAAAKNIIRLNLAYCALSDLAHGNFSAFGRKVGFFGRLSEQAP